MDAKIQGMLQEKGPSGLGGPERLGPYHLLSRLGSGAFGTVYLAEVVEERPFARVGQKLAVKVLERATKASNLARFLREAELGQAVRHPAVVQTFESGQEDFGSHRCHYLVMEYVEGRTLRQVMDQFGTIPEKLLRALALQITAALEAVHRAGAIHRDLKPTNVLMTADYQVKLSDLGIARVAGAGTSLTDPGMFLGSFNYSAPEQLQGRKLSPAADLYALGVLLYEAATGIQPFVANSMEATFLRHLHEVPPRVGKLQPEISLFFEEVICQLLEKAPEHRFASAEKLATVLRDGDVSLWWLSRQKVLRTVGPRQRPHYFASAHQELPFVGREEELEVLLTAWRGCRDGQGRLVLLEGEAGIGKSRLLEEFNHRLEGSGWDYHLLYGSDSPGSRFGPGALAQAIVDFLGEGDLQARLEEFLPENQHLIPSFAAFLRGLPNPPGTEPLSQETIHSLLRQFAKCLAQAGPVVWMIEDLHFAPAETCSLLASMVQAAKKLPLLIIATSRSLANPQALAALKGSTRCEKVVMEYMAGSEMERLLELALPMENWLRFGRKIARRCDGNPLFLSEMIREAKNATVNTDTELGTTWISEVPPSLKELLEARFGDLDEADRAVLQCGAVLGFEFEPELLAQVRKVNLLEVLERLAEIERRDDLIKSTDRGFRFVHHLFQEVVYEDLPAALRRYYHRSLAEALAESSTSESGGEPRGECAVSLCEHFLKGGEGPRGLSFALASLEHLGQLFNSEKLLEISELILAVAPEEEAELRIDVLLHQVECFYLLGRREEEARAAEAAYDLATALGDSARAVRARLLQGRLLVDSGPHAFGLLEEALEQVREVGDASTEARVLGQLGQAHLRSGRFESSLKFYRQQLELSRTAGEAASLAEAQCSMGEAYLGLHQAEHAKEPLEECIGLCEELGFSSLKARAFQAFALTWHFLADYPQARIYYGKSLELCRELGYLEMEIGALGNFSSLCLIEGDVERAEGLHARRKVLSQARPSPFLDAYLHLEEADLHRVRREPTRGRRSYQAACDLFTEIGAFYGVVEARIGLGRLAFETVDQEEARSCFRAAAELCEEQGIYSFIPLIAAYRAVLGEVHPKDVPTPETLQLPERAEGYWLLAQALDSSEHWDRSVFLLHQMSSHLEGSAATGFWTSNPIARAVEAGLGRQP